MDYGLSPDESALVGAVERLVRRHADLPGEARRRFAWFDAGLQQALNDDGFLQAGRDIGPAAAALVVMEAARAPSVVEAAVSSLVAPRVLPDETVQGPIAIVGAGGLARAQRNLPIARTALIDLGGDIVALSIDPEDIETVESIYAYPYGRFRHMPDLKRGRRVPYASPLLRHWWRVALAAEMAGATASAIDFTLTHVKSRQVFGKTVAAFQSVQHRLAQCHQAALAMRYLTLKAAWSGDAHDAALAACYAQQKASKIVFDLHQFNGAMGVTTEHTLHFWTYRLRALQSEAGGVYGAALDIAQALWGDARTEARA